MLQGRSLCKISLLIVIMIALSAYGPYDFLGLYGASGEGTASATATPSATTETKTPSASVPSTATVWTKRDSKCFCI